VHQRIDRPICESFRVRAFFSVLQRIWLSGKALSRDGNLRSPVVIILSAFWRLNASSRRNSPTVNFSLRRTTAPAVLTSLLARASTAMFLCAERASFSPSAPEAYRLKQNAEAPSEHHGSEAFVNNFYHACWFGAASICPRSSIVLGRGRAKIKEKYTVAIDLHGM
jgi:hypothetical protein